MQEQEIDEILSKSRPFRYLDQGQIAWLRSFGQVLDYEPGNIILSQGRAGTGLYVILKGYANVRIRLPGDEIISLAHPGPGNFFGEPNLLNVTQCTATVSAMDSVTCFFLSRTCFDAFAVGRPEVRFAISRALAEDVIRRYRAITREIVDLLASHRAPLNKIDCMTAERHSASLEALGHLNLLQQFSQDELQRLIAKAQILSVSEKSCLFRREDKALSCFIVIHGAVQANIVSGNKVSHFMVHAPDSLICPVSVIDKNEELFTWNTCGSATLLELTADCLNWMAEHDLPLWFKCYDLLCRSVFTQQKYLNTQLTRLANEHF